MTELVITQSGQTSLVQDQKVNRVVTEDTPPRVITSGMMPPPAVNALKTSADVDITNLQDGGILVYNMSTNMWTATNLLEKQIFEAGQF